MRKILSNKPWKQWTTRKLSFIYCMVMGTAIIITGAIAIFTAEFDTATWMSESMDYIKFMIGTGTILALVPLKDVIKIVTKSSGESEDE